MLVHLNPICPCVPLNIECMISMEESIKVEEFPTFGVIPKVSNKEETVAADSLEGVFIPK